MMSFGNFILALIVAALVLYPWSRIFRQAGYTPWLCLLFIIPLVNVITLWWFAFARWPNARGAMSSDNAYH
jgi:hypothetical protein